MLWRLFKLALKIVVFLVATSLIAAVVVLSLKGGRLPLPVTAPPPVPTPASPR